MEGATFAAEDGTEQPFWMGCYGFGVEPAHRGARRDLPRRARAVLAGVVRPVRRARVRARARAAPPRCATAPTRSYAELARARRRRALRRPRRLGGRRVRRRRPARRAPARDGRDRGASSAGSRRGQRERAQRARSTAARRSPRPQRRSPSGSRRPNSRSADRRPGASRGHDCYTRSQQSARTLGPVKRGPRPALLFWPRTSRGGAVAESELAGQLTPLLEAAGLELYDARGRRGHAPRHRHP